MVMVDMGAQHVPERLTADRALSALLSERPVTKLAVSVPVTVRIGKTV
jgi:hypothetical protein